MICTFLLRFLSCFIFLHFRNPLQDSSSSHRENTIVRIVTKFTRRNPPWPATLSTSAENCPASDAPNALTGATKRRTWSATYRESTTSRTSWRSRRAS